MALFFLLIGTSLFRSSAVMGWVALLLGLGVTWVIASALSRRAQESAAARELGVPPGQARDVMDKLRRGDREGALATIGASQEADRKTLREGGLDLAGLEPEVGKLIGWDQIVRHVFRVLDFDKSDTTVSVDGQVKAASSARPYGYLRLESPILNQPIRMPVIHRDDFWLAWSVLDEPQLGTELLGGQLELLVTYAPQRVIAGGLSGSPAHTLHYVICPRGTLERYYPNSAEGDARMARPTPENVFGPFVYQGEIQVQRNLTPAL